MDYCRAAEKGVPFVSRGGGERDVTLTLGVITLHDPRSAVAGTMAGAVGVAAPLGSLDLTAEARRSYPRLATDSRMSKTLTQGKRQDGFLPAKPRPNHPQLPHDEVRAKALREFLFLAFTAVADKIRATKDKEVALERQGGLGEIRVFAANRGYRAAT